jgi:rRNA small subunit pseudouridine methyltransferase Nep1
MRGELKTRTDESVAALRGDTVQLLHTLKIRSSDGNHTLLNVIKNPVTKYLPANSKKYALSRTGTLVNPWEWVEKLPKDEPVVFIFGAMAHGHISKDNCNYVRTASTWQQRAAT